MKEDKNKNLPNWFKGVVYSKGGNVIVSRASDYTLYLDAHALSVYHLINGYKVMGQHEHINLFQSIDWMRENYPKECKILFPKDNEKSKWEKRMKKSIRKKPYMKNK